MLSASETITLVPHLGKGSCPGPAMNSLVNFFDSPMKSFEAAGLRTAFFPASTAKNLSPLLPITAPSPPRPACRAGRRSLSASVQATEEPESRISPAGPIEMNDAVYE